MGYPLKFELTREVIVCETSLLAKLHDETLKRNLAWHKAVVNGVHPINFELFILR